MASTQITQSLQVFTDLTGQPLDAGYIYVGQANQNPETNPIAVYWDAELTQPAAQPLRTVSGYISRQGTPASIYAASSYSITVKTKTGALVYYKALDDNDSALRADLAKTSGASLVGADDGASSSLWISVQGFINKILSSAGSAVVGFVQAGTGAVARTVQDKLRETVSVKDFGAKGDGVTDDTAAFVAAMTASKTVYAPAGVYKITGLTFVSGQTIVGDGYATEIRTSGTMDFPSVRQGGIRKCKVTLTQSSVTLLDFRKTGSAGSFELYFEDVVFTGATGLTSTIGAKFTDSYINTFVNCHFIWFDKAIQFNTEAHRNNFFGCTIRSSLTYGTVLVEANAGYANSFTGCDLENCNRILDMNGGMVAFGEGCYFEAHNAAFGFKLAGGHASFHQCYFNEVFFRLQSGGSLDLSRNWIKASSLSTATYPVIRTLTGFARLILDNNTLEGTTYLARFDPTVYNLIQVYNEGTSSWSGAYPSASTHLAINDFVYDVTAAAVRHVNTSTVRATRSLSAGYTEGGQRFDGGAPGVQLVASNWNYNPLRLGAYYLWVDSTGDLRIKNGAPTFDTDGTVVGTQT